MHQLILASNSPRRRQLLYEAGFQFQVLPVNVSEELDKNLNVDEQILQIAMTKAEAAYSLYTQEEHPPFALLAADTMVVLNNEAIGKPKDPSDAALILERLSNQIHLVKTALVLISGPNKRIVTGIETTSVQFRPILRHEIENYIATGEPMDKAGAYGAQGLGAQFIQKVEGPFDNVVGLPMNLFRQLLKKI